MNDTRRRTTALLLLTGAAGAVSLLVLPWPVAVVFATGSCAVLAARALRRASGRIEEILRDELTEHVPEPEEPRRRARSGFRA